MIDVTILLLDDNYASTALGPIEVFHSAGLLWNSLTGAAPAPAFRVTVASPDGRPVRSAYGVGLIPHAAMSAVRHSDVVIVPASGLDLEGQFRRHRSIFPWLRARYGRGAYVAGICSGAAYLAEAGLLDGRRATTHWAVAADLARRYPAVRWQPDHFVTEDRRVLCSGGVYAAIDLSLYLVEKFCGHQTALRCAKSLLVDMPRTQQSGYALLPLGRPHEDEAIRRTETFLERHFAEPLTLARLAQQVHVSTRTFMRRFKAATGLLPGAYLQAVRMRVAGELLEQGGRTVEAIAAAVGYEDTAFFRKLFRRTTGMTPGEYRTRFGAVAAAGARGAVAPESAPTRRGRSPPGSGGAGGRRPARSPRRR